MEARSEVQIVGKTGESLARTHSASSRTIWNVSPFPSCNLAPCRSGSLRRQDETHRIDSQVALKPSSQHGPGAQGAPLVSVCTVTHNRRRLLSILESCLVTQNYPHSRIEWVIIDDSTYGPVPEFRRARQAGIQVVWHETPGRLSLGAKRNLSNALAKGEVMVVMDDDDFYPPSRIEHAVEQLFATGAEIAGCDRLPMLLLPEGSRWLTRSYGPGNATGNTLAYRRSYLAAGHRFDPEAEQAEEPSFLEGAIPPLLQLDPFRTLVCIGHGGNTVDKRTWIAAHGGQGFESLPEETDGFPPPEWISSYCQALGIATPASAGEQRRGGARTLKEGAGPCTTWRVAVITPYHNEPLALIQRAHASVQAQSIPCVHVLIADGPGRTEVNALDGRHLVLGISHGDNGNTPRGIGALVAMNEGFTCLAFLDADNWFSPDHIERAITLQDQEDLEVVFSQRHIVFPNGARLLTPPAEESDGTHADTSCMVLFEPAFSSLAQWVQMPKAYAPLCDRVFFKDVMARHRCGWTQSPTVYFETWYWGHFLAAGWMPPLNAKFLPCRSEKEWAEAAEAFRLRSAAPVYPGPLGIAPNKPRLNLVTILASPMGGADLLQWHLCHHFSFFGIPKNNFLWQAVERFGADHRQRISGAELLAGLEMGLPEARTIVPQDQDPVAHLSTMLLPERQYTLLEAYFRVIVSLTSPEAKDFSRMFGAVNILDCSPTLARVADVLFSCLPLQKALMMWRDPVRQVMDWYEDLEEIEPTSPTPISLHEVCETVVQSMLVPLQSAPLGQLLVVSHSELSSDPYKVVHEVGQFLGLEVNPLGATEPLPTAMVVKGPRAFEEEWQMATAKLTAPLGIKDHHGTDVGAKAEGKPLGAALSPLELQQLEALFAPLNCYFSEHRSDPLRDNAPSSKDAGSLNSFVQRVEEIAQLINHHTPRK